MPQMCMPKSTAAHTVVTLPRAMDATEETIAKYTAMFHEGRQILTISMLVGDERGTATEYNWQLPYADDGPATSIMWVREGVVEKKLIMFSIYSAEKPAPTCRIPAGVVYSDLRNVFEVYHEAGETAPRFRPRYPVDHS